MGLNMAKEKSDSFLKTSFLNVTSDVASDSSNFVQFPNKDASKLDHFKNGWGRLAERRTGSYVQN